MSSAKPFVVLLTCLTAVASGLGNHHGALPDGRTVGPPRTSLGLSQGEAPLVVTGTVEFAELDVPDPRRYVLDLKVRLRVSNSGTQPVLLVDSEDPELPAASYWYMAATVADLNPSRRLGDSGTGFYRRVTPRFPVSEKWTKLRARLDQAGPPADAVRVIRPGESLEMIRGGKVGVFRSVWASAKLKTAWLRIWLDPWDEKLEDPIVPDESLALLMRDPRQALASDAVRQFFEAAQATAFGEALQKRWAEQGLLQLRKFESEAIKIDIAKVPVR
jgi:hypothetical protein